MKTVKKFKLLSFVQIILFILAFIYLTQKLTFGSRGIFDYYKLEERFTSNKISFEFLSKENKTLQTKLSLLNETEVNMLYLEEMVRKSLNFGKEEERLIILENEN